MSDCAGPSSRTASADYTTPSLAPQVIPTQGGRARANSPPFHVRPDVAPWPFVSPSMVQGSGSCHVDVPSAWPSPVAPHLEHLARGTRGAGLGARQQVGREGWRPEQRVGGRIALRCAIRGGLCRMGRVEQAWSQRRTASPCVPAVRPPSARLSCGRGAMHVWRGEGRSRRRTPASLWGEQGNVRPTLTLGEGPWPRLLLRLQSRWGIGRLRLLGRH